MTMEWGCAGVVYGRAVFMWGRSDHRTEWFTDVMGFSW